MIAAVTGATGLLGAHVAAKLSEAGHRVLATHRPGSTLPSWLQRFPIEWRPATLGSPAALTRAFDGADWAFHCAAAVEIPPLATPALVAANVEGTAHVIEACRRAGVARLVHGSSAVTIGLADGPEPADEGARFTLAARGLADGYVVTKRAAEQLVLYAAPRDLDAVIANPCYLIGPHDPRPGSNRLVQEVARGRLPAGTQGTNCFVSVASVADGMVRLATRGRRGERYLFGDENLTYLAFFGRVAARAGVRPPRWSPPDGLLRGLGALGSLTQRITGWDPGVTSVSVAWSLCADFRFRSEKARAELGWAPEPLDAAIDASLADLRARGRC